MSTDTQIQRPQAAPLAPAFAPGEVLVVRDVTGALVTYTMNDLRGWIIPQECNDRDARAFMQFCTTSGANPFIKEAYCVCYKGKGSSMFGIAYFYRRAHESGQFDGMEATLLDAAGRPLPKTAEIKNVAAAVARAYRKDQRLPIEEVVTLKEARKTYGEFWPNDEGAKHMLLKTAKMRALDRAFPPAAGGVFAQLPRALAPEDLEDAGPQPRVVAAQAEPAPAETPAALTLAGLGTWCAQQGIPQARADRAKASCGLGARDWKAVEQMAGGLEMIRERLMQWQQSGEPEAAPAPVQDAEPEDDWKPETPAEPLMESEEALRAEIAELGKAAGWTAAQVRDAIETALEDGPDGLVAERDYLRKTAAKGAEPEAAPAAKSKPAAKQNTLGGE